jgi:2-(3-amino-3-carboxypropyl)histidine synthase|tara:strand:+ start:1122 stop:1790 length:669 start_codon:yes stop_codon:yes gene_type:complete
MKTVFIPVQYEGEVDFGKIKLDKLPKKIGIVTTAQFQDKTKETIKYLEKNNREVFIDKGRQRNSGQLLGCDQSSAMKIQSSVDVFLYIGSGEFHPLGVAMKTDKDVYIFNPVTSVFSKFNKENIEKYKKNKKIKYMKFLSADNVGIMVSLKPGQYSYKKAVEIKEKLERKGKHCFIFVFDTLDATEMQNFPFIDFWVDTACPRISDDGDKKNIIEMSELDFD